MRASVEVQTSIRPPAAVAASIDPQDGDVITTKNDYELDLVRKIRYLATIRNKLVHEYGFNDIPDRATFINNFSVARRDMQTVLARHGQRGAAQSSDLCTIM
ncbi:hypothetical protein N2152v2_002893 [Parachlorella kessleri]